MGQKPYQCQDCGDKFSQTSNLAKHMRKHGRNDCSSPPLSPIIADQPNRLINHQMPLFMTTDNKRNPNSIQPHSQQQQLTAITTSNCYHTNGQNNGNQSHHHHVPHLLHDPNDQQLTSTHTSSDQLAGSIRIHNATAMALFSNHNPNNHSNHSRSSTATATPVFVTDTNKFISGLYFIQFLKDVLKILLFCCCYIVFIAHDFLTPTSRPLAIPPYISSPSQAASDSISTTAVPVTTRTKSQPNRIVDSPHSTTSHSFTPSPNPSTSSSSSSQQHQSSQQQQSSTSTCHSSVAAISAIIIENKTSSKSTSTTKT